MDLSLRRALATSLHNVRRDLHAATAGVWGRTAPPFQRRDGSAWPAPRAPEPGRPLRVEAVEAVATDAARIWLSDPTGQPLRFQAGQFLTVLLRVDGTLQRRAYSLCSDPAHPDRVAIAVRRLPGGTVSPRLVDDLRPGDELRVLGPSGSYGHGASPKRCAHHIFLSGGAGVGPNLSLVTAVLAGEPRSHCTFVLADRSPGRLMLRHDLQALADAYPDRLRLVLMVEEGTDAWEGLEGRLDASGLDLALSDGGPLPCEGPDDRLWYLCGPPGMVTSLEPALRDRGVQPDGVCIERFVPPPEKGQVDLPKTTQRVSVRVGDAHRTIPVPAGLSILEAARQAGVTLPSSCTLGGCGACRQRLVSGRVHQRTPNCLTAAEEADGLILACVAHPLSAVVLEPV